MNSENILSCIEIESEQPAKYSVIWLHGLGADGNDFVPIASELNPPRDMRFIFPNAPVMPITINNGYEMRAWFDILTFSFHTDIDNPGIARSASHIEQLIEKEIARGIETCNIFLGGFSQGAAMSLMMGICYPKPLAGIIALSGYLPEANEVLKKASPSNERIPIFLAHGKEDPILPFTLGLSTEACLKDAGYPVAFHSYEIPHSVCQEEIRDLGQWIKKVKQI